MSTLIITILLILSAAVSLVLYCCIRISTKYDREIDDEQQIIFLEKRRRK